MKSFLVKITIVILLLIILFIYWNSVQQRKKEGILESEPLHQQEIIVGKPVENLDTQTIPDNTFNDSNYPLSEKDFAKKNDGGNTDITDNDIPLSLQEFN